MKNIKSSDWVAVAAALGGLDRHQLNGSPSKCPLCGTDDSFIFDSETGYWQCSGPHPDFGRCSGIRHDGGPDVLSNFLARLLKTTPIEQDQNIEAFIASMKIDFEQSRAFVKALQKPPTSIRLRGFYDKTDPRKSEDKGAKGAASKELVQAWVADRRGVYVVVNDGGDKDAEITNCRSFFCEWDNKPKDWQVTAWQELELPEPTIQVDTGGKSIHNYWVLAESIAPDAWRDIQTRLLEFADADRSLKNPSRVMRLPGTPHPATGEVCQIIHASDKIYLASDISKLLPLTEQIKQQEAASKSSYTPQDISEIKKALSFIAPRIPGGETYFFYRNLLWGLVKAVEEAGSTLDEAVAIMEAHSPQWKGIRQIATSGGDKINPGTFWYHCIQNGYKQPKRTVAPPPQIAQQVTTPTSDFPFRLLGFDRTTFYYLPKSSAQVISITAAQHNKNYFYLLAELEWWAHGFSAENGRIDWDSAQDAIISASIAQGVYDPSRIRGRGAWTDAERVIFHLGNRLIVDGKSHPITNLPASFESYYFYEHAKAIDGPGSEPLSDNAAREISNIAERFRWETPASAQLLLGWIVLAPACGALNWRPHIWITGGAGTGKTTILKQFMKPLLGGMYEGATGGTTEAGLRGQLRSDAIPVVFDELEQNEQKDKQIVQNILALARIASSEGGKIYKGTATGGSNTFEIRSMFCVSSINVALVQRADLDRFCVLALRKDEMERDDWTCFEQAILDTCTEENGRRLIARTLKHIPSIRKNAKTLATALSRRFGQRFGDQYGTLLAGAWSLEPNGGGELSLEHALQWIDQMDWESREIDGNDADETKCLNHILQHLLQVEGGKRMSVIELIGLARRGVMFALPGRDQPSDEVETILGRYGLRVMDGELAIANNSTNLQAILRETPWAGTAYRQALRRVRGASASGAGIRFKGMGVSRATLVPLERLE
jgi:putative DNA primase/helicase